MAPHILAVLIFVVMFVLIVMDKIERQYVSLGCGLLMIVLVLGLGMHSKDAIVETLNVKSIFRASFWYTAAEGEASSSGINWSTIIFILGMMIMVEGMGKAGFFRWLCLEIAKLVKYRTIPVFITFYADVFCTGDVHRQYYGHPVFGGSYAGAGADAQV